MDNTKELIYKMLTECTGKDMCDSGGDSGRHWQRNAKKTIEDFENEPEEHIYKDGDYIYRDLSVFHYLSELELDNICNRFNRIQSQSNNWNSDFDSDIFVYGVSSEAQQVLEYHNYVFGEKRQKVIINRSWNTYNGECDLTQCLQGANLTINKNEYILIQIHNGADVRGGYTDAKLFKLNEEGMIHSSLYEYEEQEELEQRYKEQQEAKQLQLN
tara:strand:+ start:2011 stop:2652 length:642 start_codon:yes stop_codon:yes gene_type:complete